VSSKDFCHKLSLIFKIGIMHPLYWKSKYVRVLKMMHFLVILMSMQFYVMQL